MITIGGRRKRDNGPGVGTGRSHLPPEPVVRDSLPILGQAASSSEKPHPAAATAGDPSDRPCCLCKGAERGTAQASDLA